MEGTPTHTLTHTHTHTHTHTRTGTHTHTGLWLTCNQQLPSDAFVYIRTKTGFWSITNCKTQQNHVFQFLLYSLFELGFSGNKIFRWHKLTRVILYPKQGRKLIVADHTYYSAIFESWTGFKPTLNRQAFIKSRWFILVKPSANFVNAFCRKYLLCQKLPHLEAKARQTRL